MELHKRSAEIYHNARFKIYPNGRYSLLFSRSFIFREKGYESDDEILRENKGGSDIARSIRRARSAMSDIALSNEFKFFATFTLDQSKIDRYSMDEIIKKLNVWLDNNVRRRGLRYVLVPEHHADGAIHFHGFINDALPVVESGHFDKKRHKIYNLPRWGFGFSTCIPLYGEYEHAVRYCLKYIGKTGEKIGGRWYYSGGDLQRPEVIATDVDPEEYMNRPDLYQFDVPGVGRFFEIQGTVPLAENSI